MAQVSRAVFSLILGTTLGITAISGATRVHRQEADKPLDLYKKTGQLLVLNKAKPIGFDLFIANREDFRTPIYLRMCGRKPRDCILEYYDIPIFDSNKARMYPPMFTWPKNNKIDELRNRCPERGLLDWQIHPGRDKQKVEKRDRLWAVNSSLVPLVFTSLYRTDSMLPVKNESKGASRILPSRNLLNEAKENDLASHQDDAGNRTAQYRLVPPHEEPPMPRCWRPYDKTCQRPRDRLCLSTAWHQCFGSCRDKQLRKQTTEKYMPLRTLRSR